jgi:predicted peptidase
MAHLEALVLEGPAMRRLVEGRLDEVIARHGWRNGEGPTYGVLRDTLYREGQWWVPDDDPPAKCVLDKLAACEPRWATDPSGLKMGYRLIKPLNYDPKKKYPLLVWMHGSAESGADNLRQLFGGAWDYMRDDIRAKYPCFIMAPQCPLGSGWCDMTSNPASRPALTASSNYRLAEKPSPVTRMLLDTVVSLEKEFPAIDAKRVYVSGASMGGFGTYELILRRPDLFAAAMPLCGGGDETKAAAIAKMPIWIFHGELDDRVNVKASRNMVEALKKAGGNPKYSEIVGAGHGMGAPNLNPESLEWLFSQKRP